MDPISQAVIGACAAHAILARRLPRSAWLLGAIGGLVPDLDVLIRPQGDPLGGLLWHRHFTHALVLAPAQGAILTALAMLVPAWRRVPWAVFAACTLGVLTHAPLDAATSYGTHLWWPFTRERTSWDVLPIVDPVLTLASAALLLVAAVVSWRRRASTELSAQRLPRAMALSGFLLYVAYAGIGGLQRGRALDAQAALAAARGHAIVEGRRRAMPQPLSLTLWRSVYEFRDPATGRTSIQTDFVRVPHWPYTMFGGNAEITVLEGVALPRLTRDDLASLPSLDASTLERTREIFGQFADFADGYVALADEGSQGQPLLVGDVRYGVGPDSEPLWGLQLPTLGVPGSELRFDSAFGRSRSRATELWDALVGTDPRLRPLERTR
ncbi:MAG: metal-dependent hydrolase [Phycisphaerae bacterium]|nr:metal-dependent hydrolase [Phycisphaerae bacterium]